MDIKLEACERCHKKVSDFIATEDSVLCTNCAEELDSLIRNIHEMNEQDKIEDIKTDSI